MLCISLYILQCKKVSSVLTNIYVKSLRDISLEHCVTCNSKHTLTEWSCIQCSGVSIVAITRVTSQIIETRPMITTDIVKTFIDIYREQLKIYSKIFHKQ